MIIRNKTCFVYDVEVFPNFFSVTVKNTENKVVRSFEISERENDLPNIAGLFLHKGIYFVGFNSMHYDSPIISYLLINYKRLILKPVWEITAEIKQFSDKIIKSETSASWSQYKYANIFPDLDLLAMKWSQKLRVGLKALQVTMEYKNVEEYSGNFELPLPKEDIPKLLAYNVNDVESTEELLYRCKEDIDLRLAIEDEYKVSAINKDGVNLGMEILKKKYLEATGLLWSQIKDLRSPCNVISFKDIVFPCIEFKTKEMQEFFEQVKNTTIDLEKEAKKKKEDKFHISFLLGGVEHNFSLGGMHSVNPPETFVPLPGQSLRDWDVTSMYPSIIIEWGLYPKHLGPEFLDVYRSIREERVIAKRNGDKVKNETLKLALNGLTGNLQSPYSWVYSPETVLTLRINGQLMILMLAEAFVQAGARIINTNTDGIFVLHDDKDYEKLLEICKWWEGITKIGLEEDTFERFYQYAVNDYVGVKTGWSESHNPKLIKKKGLFIDEPILGKGLAPLIIADAINSYFVNGIAPEETIKSCKDIKRFCTFQKVDKKFEVFYGTKRVAHINRYYMSMYGSMMYKQKVGSDGKVYGPEIALCADSPVTIYNKFDDKPIEERGINYTYYISEAYKIIEKMEDQQLTLW